MPINCEAWAHGCRELHTHLEGNRLERVVDVGIEGLVPDGVHRLGDGARLEELVLAVHAAEVGIARA